jgi:hypothetical protein
MSSLTAYNALRNWLTGVWTATALRFENEDPAPPQVPGDLPPFVYLEVVGDLFSQLSIGAGSPTANLWREEGSAIFHCCVKSFSGVSVARGYASTLADALRANPVPGLVCVTQIIGAGGPFVSDGNYFDVPLVTNWYRNV